MSKTSSANRGRKLEKRLDIIHNGYLNLRPPVVVRHYGHAGRYVPGPSKPRFIPWKKTKQPVDYHGCIHGRLVVFDAKAVNDPKRKSWRLDGRYTHQLERLIQWASAKAIAFFAVEHALRSHLYLYRIYAGSEWPAFAFNDPITHDLLLVRANDEGLYDWLPVVLDAWVVGSGSYIL